jgi:hypothetical protein
VHALPQFIGHPYLAKGRLLDRQRHDGVLDLAISCGTRFFNRAPPRLAIRRGGQDTICQI